MQWSVQKEPLIAIMVIVEPHNGDTDSEKAPHRVTIVHHCHALIQMTPFFSHYIVSFIAPLKTVFCLTVSVVFVSFYM